MRQMNGKRAVVMDYDKLEIIAWEITFQILKWMLNIEQTIFTTYFYP